MSEIVERLTTTAGMIEMGERIAWGQDSSLMREAAAQIDALTAALEPFAQHYTDHALTSGAWGRSELLPYVARDGLRRWLTNEDFLRARQALSPASEDPKQGASQP